MPTDIDALLDAHGSACSRSILLGVLGRNALDHEVRQGRLVRVFPRAYARPWDADRVEVREVAAVCSAGPEATLSHLSALRRWGVAKVAEDARVHVSVPPTRHPRGSAGLVIHRPRRAREALVRDGVPVVRLDDALIDSWRVLPGESRRAAVITAVQRRLTSPSRLRASSAGAAPELRRLIDLLGAGCRSELELWGYLNVFDPPDLRVASRQRAVTVGRRRVYLDLAYEDARVAVELDGRAFHADAKSWERDIARDLMLATAGWQTVRFSHRRLTRDPAGCRRDLRAVLAGRRIASS
ncbi:MAG TPA: DUF559 domain-containing protein [Jatrophihabitantaceae bacterium]|jgi:very-short-patch-repair endonuclease|nr:DUF559 domain-containing protein [Jatrophihabitantaceae bacterium]